MEFDDVWQIKADATVIDFEKERQKRRPQLVDPVEEAKRNHPAGKGLKQETAIEKIPLPTSSEQLVEHFKATGFKLGQGHSFTEATKQTHLIPYLQKLAFLDDNKHRMSQSTIDSLFDQIYDHLENLHADAHAHGPSGSAEANAQQHVHFEE